MSWPTALNDLRIALSDGPFDRLRSQKKVLGALNGTNVTFKTFEHRRSTNFAGTGVGGYSFPCGIFIDDVYQAASAVTLDDPRSGYFQIIATAPPGDDSKITATYYAQFFLDTDLQGFLTEAMTWLGMGTDATQVPSDFISAAMEYAKSRAYGKMALMVAEAASQGYQLEDAPDEKVTDAIRAYQTAAKQALDASYKARDDAYTRKGQAKAPRSGVISGNIKNPTRS